MANGRLRGSLAARAIAFTALLVILTAAGVVAAAYAAFGRGLNISLNIAGGLLLASSILAVTTVYGKRIHLERVNSDHGHPLHVSVNK